MSIKIALLIYVYVFLLPLWIFSDEINSTIFEFKEGGESQNIQLLLTSNKNVYSPCEPIILSITATNISDSTFCFRMPLAMNNNKFSFTVYNKTKEIQSNSTNFGKSEFRDVLSGYILFFKPQDTYKKKFLINRFFDMSLSGDYIISATYQYVDFTSNTKFNTKTNCINIIISDEHPIILDNSDSVTPFSIQFKPYSTREEINTVAEPLKNP